MAVTAGLMSGQTAAASLLGSSTSSH